MPLFLIVSEIYGLKSRNGEKSLTEQTKKHTVKQILRPSQGRRHGFESGGTILRVERAKKFFLTPLLFGQWGGGQNIA